MKSRLSPSDLNTLMTTLGVDVVALTEILVPSGYRVEMGKVDAPGIHYNLAGHGTIAVAGGRPFSLAPHTLIIVPPNAPISIEVRAASGKSARPILVGADCHRLQPNGVLRVAVEALTPEVIQICGFFDASYGASIGLFRDLREPIVERFEPTDRIDAKLKEALRELVSQEIGAETMTALLLKQVIVALVRRSLGSSQIWAERFSILSDRQIARAFAEMSARPGAAHTVQSLAEVAGLSRSAFMARFAAMLGRSPMATLRQLRMRQAAQELATTASPVDLVARNAGYASRSSFDRAFRDALGQDPSRYRAARSGRSI